MNFMRFTFLFALFLALTVSVTAQTPVPTPPQEDDVPERIFTEEIKLNVLAFDESGKFFSDVKKEDLVISEDGRLHQASSIRRLPAHVLIVLDTGGEMRQAKSIEQTKLTARSLINALAPQDSVAILQYHDRAEIIAEWTTKEEALKILNSKINFGRRSVFVDALELAGKFMQRSPVENKHLVLISDGTDSINNKAERNAAMNRLLASSVSVHVISYTGMEREKIEPRAKGITNSPPPKALPSEVAATLPNGVRDVATAPPIGPTINVDREFLRKMRERKNALVESEQYLSSLAADTNGEFILPETPEEMIEKTALVARVIDSSYVVTYTPKRALSESKKGEVRNIEVTSKRPGLDVQARRKVVVEGNE